MKNKSKKKSTVFSRAAKAVANGDCGCCTAIHDRTTSYVSSDLHLDFFEAHFKPKPSERDDRSSIFWWGVPNYNGMMNCGSTEKDTNARVFALLLCDLLWNEGKK